MTGVSAKPATGGFQDIFYAESGNVPLPVIERAAGIFMYDEEGNTYIDASSGPVVSNIGHGNPHVADAMAKQARTMDFAYSRVARHRPNMRLAERLSHLAGPGFERVALASGGSEAVEFSLKFLRQYVLAMGNSQRRHIITNLPSYHGGTIATLAITGDDALAPFLDGFATVSSKIPAPLSYRIPENFTAETYALQCANALEAEILRLGPDNVLAFVIEPVGGLATGCVVPPASYFHSIRSICSRYGVFLVFDEVLCGVGRTGRFLAAHHWPDALPDVVVLAKGLGSGYTPLAAVLLPATLVDDLAKKTGFNFSHTYNANPISCAAGLAVLDEYERLDLVNRARNLGTYLAEGLSRLKETSPLVGDVRGMGLLYAVELVMDKQSRKSLPSGAAPTERIRIHALRHGLILYSRRTAGGRYGDWFMISPPLTVTELECDELLGRVSEALEDLCQDYRSEGILT